MALNFGKGNRSIAFAPTAAFPLNANSYFESYDLALAAALTAKPAGDTSTKYYFGQEIAVAEMVDNVPQSAKLYIIAPEVQEDGSVVGTLQEVGSAADGDGKSIELVEGVLSVKDFGKRFYKYLAATETEEAKYELVEVSESNPWKAGLQPRIDAEGNIAWYEPNPTTIEGVQDQVTGIQGDVEQAQKDIDAVEVNLVKAEEKIDSINDTLYGTEGEEAVEGLVDKVATLEGEMDAVQEAIENTYTKEEVDGLVSGVFHFKGEAESVEALPAASAENVGHVYQVGDIEYASNGTEWVELGFVVDLSSYATKTYVDGEVKKVQDALDIAEGIIEGHTSDIEEINGAIERIDGEIDTIDEKILALEEADEGFVSQFETVNGKIEALESANETSASQFETVNSQISALENADEDFETRVGSLESSVSTLEGLVGTPTGDIGALYPAVESLNKRLNDIVAEGGEPNQLNGISINGTALVPNEALIIDLPIFTGTNIGLVPVVGSEITSTASSFLNAEGQWINVESMVDDKLTEVLTWETIAAE